MRAGFILECGPDGADYKVLDHVVRSFCASRPAARAPLRRGKRIL